VHFSRPVISPIPHHNRWEKAAAQYAAMDISRDGVIRISTPSATRDSMIVPHRVDPRSEVYDGGGTRLVVYAPNPHDQWPARQFDIRIERYTPPSVLTEREMEDECDGGGGYPSQDMVNSYDDFSAAQSSDSVDNLQ